MVKSFSVISGWLMKGLYGIFGAKHSGEGFGRELQADGSYKSVGKLALQEYESLKKENSSQITPNYVSNINI